MLSCLLAFEALMRMGITNLAEAFQAQGTIHALFRGTHVSICEGTTCHPYFVSEETEARRRALQRLTTESSQLSTQQLLPRASPRPTQNVVLNN